MSEVFILVIEDRHIDVDVCPYSTFEKANAALEDWLEQSVRHPEDVKEHKADSVYRRHVTYTCEGDCVSIQRKTVDADE